jgi:hypothetical protein
MGQGLMAFRLALNVFLILAELPASQPQKVFAEGSISLFATRQKTLYRLTPRARAFVSD